MSHTVFVPLRFIQALSGYRLSGLRGGGREWSCGSTSTSWIYLILAIYFVFVLGIGFAAKRYIKTSLDYFLSGRSLPAWITGLAFISANLGALEILGMAANGAQFGVYTVHYYWVGAIPAMIFLGLVMMPFYYGSKVRSVPEYLRLRFNKPTHVFNSLSFALATVLIAGVNLYALALVLKLLLGWPILLGIVVAAAIVLVYITLGGLSSAIYNEVLQFFMILAALIPLTIVGLIDVGGWSGLKDNIVEMKRGDQCCSPGRAPGSATSTIRWGLVGPDRVRARLRALVRLLDDELRRGPARAVGQEPQRRAAHAADRRLPEDLHPGVTIIPGLVALVTIKGLGGDQPNMEYNNAIPLLMNEYLPNGMLGLALMGLIAAFMAGVAANVSRVQHGRHLRPLGAVRPERQERRLLPALRPPRDGRGHRDRHRHGADRLRLHNIMDYIQLLFSFFNAPLFATFIIGMFWKRMTPWAGFFGLIAGTARRGDRHYGATTGAGHRPRVRPGARRSGARSRPSSSTRSSPWASRSSPSPSRSRSCRASSTAWPPSTRASDDPNTPGIARRHARGGRDRPDRHPQLRLRLGETDDRRQVHL